MQEVFAIDISGTKTLHRLMIAVNLIALVALGISGLHLAVKVFLAILLLVGWIICHRKYIQQRNKYQVLAYFDDLASIKNSPATMQTAGWRIRNSADQWINLDLQNHSIFLNSYILLSFVLANDDGNDDGNERTGDSANNKSKETIQLPLISGDIVAEHFRALKVFLRFSK